MAHGGALFPLLEWKLIDQQGEEARRIYAVTIKLHQQDELTLHLIQTRTITHRSGYRCVWTPTVGTHARMSLSCQLKGARSKRSGSSVSKTTGEQEEPAPWRNR